MRSDQVVTCLGRGGDVCISLEIARHLSRNGPVRLLTCKDCAPILDGVSYASPTIWPWDYSKLQDSVQWLKMRGVRNPIVCQSYCHPDANRNISYQEDAYRLAGFQNLFGALPLVFNKRNQDREWKLLESLPVGKPWIAVCTEGISSPCPTLKDLIPTLVQQYPDYEVIDLSKIRAYRLFDMLAILDFCSLLISVDTVFLHLARASKCPVMAVVNDLDPWRASVPPPSTIHTFGYKTVSTPIVAQAVGEFFTKKDRKVFLAANIFGETPRHVKAYRSWKKLLERGILPAFRTEYDRSFEGLPYLKDILQVALDQMGDDDVVVWCNSDVELRPEIIDWAKNHVGTYGAATMRRNEGGHVGRELIALRGDCLRKHWDEIPDYCIGAPVFDIGMAAFIREKVGVKTTLDNLSWDFFHCDAPQRYALHEPHESSWRDDSAPALYNRGLFDKWISEKGWKFWQ